MMSDRKRITFENFLSGCPSRDYIFQKVPYEDQIRQAAKMIREADYVLLGVGAGMSMAACAIYGGEWFKENFADFRAKYGDGPYMQDMYGAGFYPYPSEEAYWGYWSKQCMKAGIEADHTALHKTLLSMLDGKKSSAFPPMWMVSLRKQGLQLIRFSAHRAITFISSVQKAVTQTVMMPENCSGRWMRQGWIA